MRIPAYWARGRHASVDRRGKAQTFWAWGWSFDSLTAAREEATARAKRILDYLKSGRKLDSYDYLDRPPREEIVESIGPNDEEMAIITRNRYGALILNTASVCFVDIDFPNVPLPTFLEAILLLFSKSRRAERRKQKARATPEATLQRVRNWAKGPRENNFTFCC